MFGRSILSKFLITISVFFFIACEQKNENGKNESISELSEAITSSETRPSADTENSLRVDPMPDHRYLNTIDWEVRQPLDLSTTMVRTTANSTADRVLFTYNCDGEERKSTAVPIDGRVTDTIDWNCDSIMTTEMVAVGADTTVEYLYTIDIAFLNRLGQ